MDAKVLISNTELLDLASRRVDLPSEKPLLVIYDDEADSLFIKYSETPSIISKSKDTDGVVFDFDAEGNLVSVEVLDLYEVFS
jgi:uncharacterized protein YuzE